MKTDKTNALRILDRLKISYVTHEFPADVELTHSQLSDATGVPLDMIYKTLVTVGRSGEHYVFVIPVESELDLKKAAKAAGEKSVAMVKSRELLGLTGYIHGGCSPVGMKKQFRTFIDLSADGCETFSVSGGRRGLQAELNPNELAEKLGFRFLELEKRG